MIVKRIYRMNIANDFFSPHLEVLDVELTLDRLAKEVVPDERLILRLPGDRERSSLSCLFDLDDLDSGRRLSSFSSRDVVATAGEVGGGTCEVGS